MNFDISNNEFLEKAKGEVEFDNKNFEVIAPVTLEDFTSSYNYDGLVDTTIEINDKNKAISKYFYNEKNELVTIETKIFDLPIKMSQKPRVEETHFIYDEDGQLIHIQSPTEFIEYKYNDDNTVTITDTYENRVYTEVVSGDDNSIIIRTDEITIDKEKDIKVMVKDYSRKTLENGDISIIDIVRKPIDTEGNYIESSTISITDKDGNTLEYTTITKNTTEEGITKLESKFQYEGDKIISNTVTVTNKDGSVQNNESIFKYDENGNLLRSDSDNLKEIYDYTERGKCLYADCNGQVSLTVINKEQNTIEVFTFETLEDGTEFKCVEYRDYVSASEDGEGIIEGNSYKFINDILIDAHYTIDTETGKTLYDVKSNNESVGIYDVKVVHYNSDGKVIDRKKVRYIGLDIVEYIADKIKKVIDRDIYRSKILDSNISLAMITAKL